MAQNETIDALKKVVASQIAGIHTATVGKIISYNSGTGQATVQPSIKYKAASGDSYDYPAIVNVPVYFPTGGGSAITYPIKAGDDCCLIFSERSLDDWINKKEKTVLSSPSYTIDPNFPGMVEQGNIDLSSRPTVKLSDGSIATVRSLGINVDGKEYLIPTVSHEGTIMTNEEAFNYFKNNGEHLGIFESIEASNRYAKALHESQEKLYVSNDTSTDPRKFDLTDCMAFVGMKASRATNNNAIEIKHGSCTLSIPENGPVSINTDLIVNGISFLEHVHGGVSTGSSKTNVPE